MINGAERLLEACRAVAADCQYFPPDQHHARHERDSRLSRTGSVTAVVKLSPVSLESALSDDMSLIGRHRLDRNKAEALVQAHRRVLCEATLGRTGKAPPAPLVI